MNDIEKYFSDYRSLADEAGDNPSVTEQDFLVRLHREQARKRFHARTLALTFIGMAAALAVFVILREPEVPVNPVELYMTSYREGVAPLLSEVREMEMSSELCREMDLSSVIEELLDSSDGMTDGLDGWKMLRNWKLPENIVTAALTKSGLCTANAAGHTASGRHLLKITEFKLSMI